LIKLECEHELKPKQIHDDSMNDFTIKSIHFRSKSYLISHLKDAKG